MGFEFDAAKSAANKAKHGIDFVDEYLARWQAKIVNLGNRTIWVPADAEKQAEAKRFLPLIGRYRWSQLHCAEIRHEIVGRNTISQDSLNGAQPGCQSSSGSLKKRSATSFDHGCAP